MFMSVQHFFARHVHVVGGLQLGCSFVRFGLLQRGVKKVRKRKAEKQRGKETEKQKNREARKRKK